MSTNDESESTESQEEVVSTDAEAELREAKAEAETNSSEETEQVAQSTESAEEEAQAESTFTKEVPSIPGDTPEEYYKNLEKAYQNSTTEALRLKGELDKKVEAPVAPVTETLTPEQLYIRQKQNEEITEAFNEVSDKYPQLKDQAVYDRFVAEAQVVGKVITESEQRLPSPKELYAKTAVILGLNADNSEELGTALKDAGASTRTSSAIPAGPQKSKVTDEMINLNMKMYPNKTRQEIIEELEPHIN